MADIENEMVSIDLNKQKSRLLAMQEQLQRDIANKVAQTAESGDELDPNRGGVSNHMADDANDTSEQETMVALQQGAERELARVQEALAAIDAGTYGICTNCGKPISPARLEALPWATLCIDCQRLQDQGRLL